MVVLSCKQNFVLKHCKDLVFQTEGPYFFCLLLRTVHKLKFFTADQKGLIWADLARWLFFA